MWYAKEKGWDKEAGLDIDILFFDSGMAILNALPAGEWQYSCLGGVPAMMGNLRYGTSVIGVGTDESACVAVLARPDNPVFKTKGLNPKHPGVFGSPETCGRPASAPRFPPPASRSPRGWPSA
ncbi:MAG: ABC transporter substrate-binding protein [Bilophila wadsworthia]